MVCTVTKTKPVGQVYGSRIERIAKFTIVQSLLLSSFYLENTNHFNKSGDDLWKSYAWAVCR